MSRSRHTTILFCCTFLAVLTHIVAGRIVTEDISSQVSKASKADQSHNLSWQSAYWGLVALAINNVAQPSGKLSCFPENASCILKASPFMGLLEVISSLFHLCRFMYKYEWSGYDEWVVYTLNKKFPLEARENEQPPVSEVQRNSTLRVILFVLGALPAYMKIHACTGVDRTQTIATFYLVGFLYDNFMIDLNQRYPRVPVKTEGYDTHDLTVLIAIIWAPSIIALRVKFFGIEALTETWICLLFFFDNLCATLPKLCGWLSSYDKEPNSPVIYTTVIYSVSNLLWLLLGALRSEDSTFLLGLKILTLIIFMYGEILMKLGFLFSNDASEQTKRKPRQAGVVEMRVWPYTEFVRVVITGFIVYHGMYDPTTTYRPPWTDSFG